MTAAIVVPVYGAAEALRRCLASLERSTDLVRNPLILAIDGPQDSATERALEAAPASAERVRLAARGGFAAAANAGLAVYPDRDAILLNSDTQVAAKWAEGLAEAAMSQANVASVTPFSNAATIASLPRWLDDNALPAGHGVESFAALVRAVSRHERPPLITGVGFCLYLRRKALTEVGPFDPSFGIGYGEEVDWCLRARARNFVHLLDDATFVYHEGQASFGGERRPRVAAAERALRRRYPSYWGDLAAYLKSDPAHAARQRVVAALTPKQQQPTPTAPIEPKVVHVVHGWPPWSRAGTEMYAAWLARWQSARRPSAAYARVGQAERPQGHATELLDDGVRVRLINNRFTARNPLRRNAIRDRPIERDFARFLAEERPALVHVHHLAGLSARLPGVARRMGIPVVMQLQDWWTGCARANLLDAERRLCPGPTAARCDRCLPLTRRPPRRLWNTLLLGLRNRTLRREVRLADARICGSNALRDSFAQLGWVDDPSKILVLEYGVPEPPGAKATAGPVDAPLRCGFIGSLLPHKGAHVALAAWRLLPAGRATLTLWGDPTASPDYFAELRALATPDVVFEPPFSDDQKDDLFAGLDLLVMPSLGLESYGLVAREAFAHGVPVIAARRGALPEVFARAEEGHPFGATFDPERPDELASWIERLATERDLLARWRRSLPETPSVDRHALEIEAIYSQVLARQRVAR